MNIIPSEKIEETNNEKINNEKIISSEIEELLLSQSLQNVFVIL